MPRLKILFSTKERLFDLYTLSEEQAIKSYKNLLKDYKNNGYNTVCPSLGAVVDDIDEFRCEVFNYLGLNCNYAGIYSGVLKLIGDAKKKVYGSNYKYVRAGILFGNRKRAWYEIKEQPIYEKCSPFTNSPDKFNFMAPSKPKIIGYEKVEQVIGNYADISDLVSGEDDII